ncbi:T9SS type A sorting domain-containing protein [Hymenobacter daeguensis]
MEFTTGAGNPSGNGPTVANQLITFQKNTNNPSGNTFAAYTPTTTATLSLSNQQYTLPTTKIATGTGVAFGGNINNTGPLAPGLAIFPNVGAVGSSTNANYSSLDGVSGGIDVTANNGVEVFVSTEPLASNASTNVRYQFADLTITFNRAVFNPVVHLTGLGGKVVGSGLGITSELDLLTSGVTMSRLSGSTELSVSSTQITNNAAVPDGPTGAGGASGSVLFVTPPGGITSLQFRIYLRATTGSTLAWHSTNNSSHSADGWIISVSAPAPNPVATPNTITRANLSGTLQTSIPSNAFAGTDTSPYVLSSLTLTTFPTNATSIVINGTLYTSATFAAASAAARTLLTDDNGNLAAGQTLSIDPLPLTGGSSVLPFTVTDDQGATSTAANLTINYQNPTVLTGVVFEDVNYGGGVGRPYATANTSATGSGFVTGSIRRSGATVELYDNNGAFVASTTTDATGGYLFSVQPNSNYTVRIVNSTVTSVRTGYTTALLPVQTYNGTTNHVGGEYPGRTDAGANTTSATLASLTPASGTTAAESIATFTTGSGLTFTGPDFGFNFDVVTNTNDAGQGSLRQFITNSNALGNVNLLAQSGSNTAGALVAGRETSIFMIPDGAAHNGQAAGLASGLNGTGGNANAAVITLSSALPAITAANTSIDATTQTFNIANSNTGTVGTGGTVGTAATALSAIARPEVVINANNTSAITIQGNADAVSGLAIYNASNSNTAGAITVTNAVTGAANRAVLTQLLVGTLADGSDPGTGLRNRYDGLHLEGSFSITNDYFGYNGNGLTIGNGTSLTSYAANAAVITNNEFVGNGGGNGVGNSVTVFSSTNVQVTGNLIRDTQGSGIANVGNGVELWFQASNNTVSNNTFTANNTSGIVLSQNASNNTISQNVISGTLGTAAANSGPGILMLSSTFTGLGSGVPPTNNTISQNSTFNNHGLGIDLVNAYSLGDGVTKNDNNDADGGPNGQLNYPVITSAVVSGTNLTVKGFARPGAIIELFSVGATADPTSFGEGQTYLGTVTEGSAADTDASTNQSYGFVNTLDQGTDNSANGFSFTIPISSLSGGTLALGTVLSSTATLSGSTSEFSGNVVVRDATVANDDQATTTPATAITFPVTSNDVLNADIATATIDLDPNTAGIQTSFTVTGEGTYTTVGVTAGSVKFTPVGGFTGISNTPYTVQNTSGATSNQANLIVRVESQFDLATTITTASGGTVTPNTSTAISGTTVNNSLISVANIVQSIQLPPGLTGTINATVGASSFAASYNATTGLITFPNITLAAGATSNWSVTFTAPVSGPFSATASVTPLSGDIVPGNNSTTIQLNVATQTDLSTSIAGPTANPVAGNLVNYAVTTANSATSSPAAGVVQTVQLPTTGITGVYATNGGVYSATAGTVTFNGVPYAVAAGTVTFPPVNLAPGQVVNNVVSFAAPAAGTVLSGITATVPTANDNATANNTATAGSVTTQAATATTANLYVTLTGPAQIAAGGTAIYYVTQGNNGPSPASAVQTVVALPAGVGAGMFVNGATGSQSGSVYTFGAGGPTYNSTTGLLTFPALATQANAAAPQSYNLSFNAPSTATSIAATASVSSATTELVAADNMMTVQTEILPSADVAITMTNVNGSTSITSGQTVNYVVQTQNYSDYAAKNVQQTVNLPIGLPAATFRLNGATGTLSGSIITFGSGATASTYDVTTGLLTLPLIGSLSKGTLVNNTISFVAPGVSTNTGIRALASVTSTTPDAVPANNTVAVTSGSINTVEDLTVSIAGPTTKVVVGSPVLYAVTTTNNGPSTTGSQTTTVQLPTGLSGVEVRDNSGAIVTGAYVAATGVVSFNATTVSTVGESVTGTISFLAPDATQLSLSAVVALTTGSSELNTDNNTARISTPLVSQSLAPADLATTFTAAPAASLAPNATATYTVRTTNNGTATAQNPVQYISLPANLPTATLTLGGATGTASAGVVTFAGGATYNISSGLLTVPSATALANGSTLQSTVTFTMPPADITVTANSASDNPDGVTTNNIVRSSTTTSPQADVVLTMTGPAQGVAGNTVSYNIMATNVGPSTATGVTVKVTLPAGVSSYTVNGGAQSGSGQVTLSPQNQSLLQGASYTFVVAFTAPAITAITVPSVVTTTSLGNITTNDNASVRTSLNVAPVANDVVNTLQSPEGNTAGGLLLSPLTATDVDGNASIVQYTITSIPNTATQGTLLYNNGGSYAAVNVGQTLTPTQATTLKFDPLASFIGSVFFTYTATDNGNGTAGDALTSPAAIYTVQVGKDSDSKYTATPAKGGANKYVNNDVLAFVIDPNGSIYNGAATGLVYNPDGTLAAGTVSNGLPTTGTTNAVLAASGSGPASNPTNVLPAGTALNTTTGQIYVVNAALLPRIIAATTYNVNVITTDVNGGTNTVLATFTLGAYPLPVELVAFTAKAVNNVDAALSWTTASEKNNDRFEVERSLTGTDYVKIGEVQGQGSKASATDYRLTDAGVGRQAAGPVYYRLRQVDTDGTATYSPVRPVVFARALTPGIALYPNPATAGTTELDLRQLPAGRYEVSVLDATGRAVLHAAGEAGLGQVLDLRTLASGTYTVRVQGQGLNLTKRLIKE